MTVVPRRFVEQTTAIRTSDTWPDPAAAPNGRTIIAVDAAEGQTLATLSR